MEVRTVGRRGVNQSPRTRSRSVQRRPDVVYISSGVSLPDDRLEIDTWMDRLWD